MSRPRYGKLPPPPTGVSLPQQAIRVPFGGPAPSNPLQPLWNPPGPPVSSGQPTPQGQEFSSSIALKDGGAQVLVNLGYNYPHNINLFVTAPILNQPSAVFTTGTINGHTAAGAAVNLSILGEAVLGIGGTSYKFNFDIPIEQMAQLSCVCESLKVSARLYVSLAPTEIAVGPPSLWNYGATSIEAARAVIDPPAFDGTLDAGYSPIFVQGLGGQGHSGISNLTRRLWVPAAVFVDPTAIVFAPAPSMATFVRALGDPNAGAAVIREQGAAGSQVTGPIPIGFTDIPLASWVWGNSSGIRLQGGSATDYEIIYRLGLAGVLS